MNEGVRVFTAVLTGGPGGGKSDGIKYLLEELPKRGFAVLAGRELATDLFTRGFNIAPVMNDPVLNRECQRQMIKTKLAMQKQMRDFARLNPAPLITDFKVLLLDRGTLDDRVYMPPADFQKILDEESWTIESLGEEYDGVYHMTSAALGAEEAYEKARANNPARRESAEEAREVERRTRLAWAGHSQLRIIENIYGARVISFEKKLKILLDHTLTMIGMRGGLD